MKEQKWENTFSWEIISLTLKILDGHHRCSVVDMRLCIVSLSIWEWHSPWELFKHRNKSRKHSLRRRSPTRGDSKDPSQHRHWMFGFASFSPLVILVQDPKCDVISSVLTSIGSNLIAKQRQVWTIRPLVRTKEPEYEESRFKAVFALTNQKLSANINFVTALSPWAPLLTPKQSLLSKEV